MFLSFFIIVFVFFCVLVFNVASSSLSATSVVNARTSFDIFLFVLKFLFVFLCLDVIVYLFVMVCVMCLCLSVCVCGVMSVV